MRYFIVMSGLPGSGKTSLGRSLAHALDLPLLDKDDILEAMFDSLGTGAAAIARWMSLPWWIVIAVFGVIYLLRGIQNLRRLRGIEPIRSRLMIALGLG